MAGDGISRSVEREFVDQSRHYLAASGILAGAVEIFAEVEHIFHRPFRQKWNQFALGLDGAVVPVVGCREESFVVVGYEAVHTACGVEIRALLPGSHSGCVDEFKFVESVVHISGNREVGGSPQPELRRERIIADSRRMVEPLGIVDECRVVVERTVAPCDVHRKVEPTARVGPDIVALDTDGIEPHLPHVFICVAQLDFAVELLKNLFHFIASYRGMGRIVVGVCGMTYRRRDKCGDYENI